MGPPFSPIQALPRQAVSCRSQRLKIDSLSGKPSARGFSAHFITPSFSPDEILALFERGNYRHSQFAG